MRQFIGSVGYYRQFIQDLAELSETLVALTRKGSVFVWTSERQAVFEAGAQFTLRTDHRSLWWPQMFRNSDGMLACWYMLIGQFSMMFEYRPGDQHANADGMSHQCGQ